MQSKNINELAAALAKAQGQMTAPELNRQGYGYKYADLNSVWKVCRTPLKENGLCVVQGGKMMDGKMGLSTRLCHASGQWMESFFPIVESKKPIDESKKSGGKNSEVQDLGACITYLRRYALTAMLSVNGEDDVDGAYSGVSNRSDEHTPQPSSAKTVTMPKLSTEEANELADALGTMPDLADKVRTMMTKQKIVSLEHLPRETYNRLLDKIKTAHLEKQA